MIKIIFNKFDNVIQSVLNFFLIIETYSSKILLKKKSNNYLNLLFYCNICLEIIFYYDYICKLKYAILF